MFRPGSRRSRSQRAILAAAAVTAVVVSTPALAAASAMHLPLAVARQQAAGASHVAAVGAISAARTASTAAAPAPGADETRNSLVATEQWTQARTAPGVVAPGAYGAAYSAFASLPGVGGTWSHVTGLVYNSDDQRYRDYNSNSSGGSGNVTGRITGLAADASGYVYAAGANGGVWRSSTGGGSWTPIADSLPSLSSGALELDSVGRLWYGTGEANTGATSFVGAGVFVLVHPRTGIFAASMRVGGNELESTIIHALRFGPGVVYAATSRGVWSHSTLTLTGPWTLVFAPNPAYLPGGSLATDPSAPYKNIANDVAIDPAHPDQIVLALGWRGGDTYNGLYRRSGSTWARFNPAGQLPGTDIGNLTFAYSGTGSKLYVINESIVNYSSNPNTALGGVYVSGNGSPYGPFTLIADSPTLMNSGSALTGAGYQPGIQAWYNQSLRVDPTNDRHVIVGLEEVFETTNGGESWKTVGPYWNFAFPCWSNAQGTQSGTCPQTTHPDQHAATFGYSGGRFWTYVGNDGGVYRRPMNGSTDALGHATDWASLNDGTIDALQYYAVGVGVDRRFGGVVVSGGLQDNGVSVLRGNDTVMGSSFGGDGGDTLVDPRNGCNQVQEYVYLAMSVTNNCNYNRGDGTPATSTSRAIAPADPGPRFIAPFSADPSSTNTWVAGGEFVWVQHAGFAIKDATAWTSVFDLGVGHSATSVAVSRGKAYVGWCGPCNNQGFTRGIAVGNTDGTGWKQLTLPVSGLLPNRFVAALAVDPAAATHVVVGFSGFSRAWTEGPGAGIGHLFESFDSGATWTDISANLPDVPVDSVKLLADDSIVVGTDFGVVIRQPDARTWSRLGAGLPTATVTGLDLAPNGRLYAATHGRGIWAIEP